EIDLLRDGECRQLVDFHRRDGHAFGQGGNASVARRAKEFGDARALGDFPRERVFAPATANDQDSHRKVGRHCRSNFPRRSIPETVTQAYWMALMTRTAPVLSSPRRDMAAFLGLTSPESELRTLSGPENVRSMEALSLLCEVVMISPVSV